MAYIGNLTKVETKRIDNNIYGIRLKLEIVDDAENKTVIK